MYSLETTSEIFHLKIINAIISMYFIHTFPYILTNINTFTTKIYLDNKYVFVLQMNVGRNFN